MKLFRKGIIKNLIATEAAGMVYTFNFQVLSWLTKKCIQGADIPDIELIIQFGVPVSLSVWSQPAGRAGRSPHIKAQAVLLVERLMFKCKKKKPGGNKNKKQVQESSLSESDAELSNSGSVSEHDKPVLPVVETLESLSDHEDDGKEWGKRVNKNL
jgi:superfamily II DNA or RNA helicase